MAYAYALVDAQSDVPFIDQEICKKLQVATEPVKLKLTTMTGRDTLVNSQRVKGLRVRGLHSNLTLDLPPAYTKDDIPLDRDRIPTCETTKKWEHLSVISHEMSPLKEFGVGLLIGYDCLEALVPRRVITGGKGEPYTVQTDLGWGIVGGKQQIANSRQVTVLCHQISVQELTAVSSAAVIKILESDFADISSKEIPRESHTELSMGDPEVKIVQTLSTAAKCQDDILERLARCSKWNTVINVVA